MRKWALITLALVAVGLPKLLEVIGLASTSEDLNTWGRWLRAIGIENTIALIVLGLAGWLFAADIRSGWLARLPTRCRELNLKRQLRNFFAPVKWRDYELFLKTLSINCDSVPELRNIATHPDLVQQYLLRIEGFKLLGENKTGRPLKVTSAYLQSLITGEKLAVTIDGLAATGLVIPPHTVFRADANFPCPDHWQISGFHSGLPLAEFRRRYREFRFVFEVEGYRHQEDFGADEVDLYLYNLVVGLQWKLGNLRAAILPVEAAA